MEKIERAQKTAKCLEKGNENRADEKLWKRKREKRKRENIRISRFDPIFSEIQQNLS